MRYNAQSYLLPDHSVYSHGGTYLNYERRQWNFYKHRSDPEEVSKSWMCHSFQHALVYIYRISHFCKKRN